MSNSVISQFVKKVNTVLANNPPEWIKDSINDSVNNNRTPSVSQLVRFLSLSKSTNYRSLARKLYTLHIAFGSNSRKRNSRRSDAIDVTELLSYLSAINTHADVQTKKVVKQIING
jgi:hypothetical protein